MEYIKKNEGRMREAICITLLLCPVAGEIQAKIYEEIKDISSSEIMAYFKKKAQDSPLWQRLANRDKAKVSMVS